MNILVENYVLYLLLSKYIMFTNCNTPYDFVELKRRLKYD